MSDLAAVQRVIESGRYVLGPELAAFEEEFADYLGVEYVVGVSSGTDALHLICRALMLRPGDEVLVPALTFIGTAEAVARCGATPVFTDVDPDTLTMTFETAEPHVTPRTKAIMAVHLFGNPAPVDELAVFDEIAVIEDACQAVGSSYRGKMCGGLGAAAAFSFYPSKNLSCLGDGGAITTNDRAIAEEARLLRHHGARGTIHHLIGGTHRLDEIQAAVLRERLQTFKPTQSFATDQQATRDSRPSWHQVVTFGRKPSPRARRYYDPPLHLQPSMQRYWRQDLPVAERFAKECWCVAT